MSEGAQGVTRSAVPITVPITRVTVLEDRASVRRQATLALAVGAHTVRIEGLAPVLVDKSVSVVGEGARVGDVRIRRLAIHRSEAVPSELLRSLRQEERAIRGDIRAMDERAAGIEAEIASVAQALGRGIQDVGEDTAWGRSNPDRWREDLDAFEAVLESSQAELAELRHRRKLRSRDLADVHGRITDASSPSSERRCWLEVDLEVERADAALRVDYMVPAAAWRPAHRAHLLTGEGGDSSTGATVRFETEACVWQRTGEDWEGVELRVSTERLSAGAEPPRLVSDELRVRPKDQQVQVSMREREVEAIGVGEGARVARAEAVPGVDDGGRAVLRTVSGPATVRSDGKPHRLPLGGFEAEAEQAYVCVPELEAAVVLRTRLTNEGEHAILAGPVELHRNAGVAGRSRVLYVAPGERFDLGWGPEPSLRVHREVVEAPPERGMLSRWTEVPHVVTVRIGHLGLAPETYDVELLERVPVSEVDAVRVEVDRERTSEGARPDSDGFVRWQERLVPGARWKVELRWTLAKRRDVVGV